MGLNAFQTCNKIMEKIREKYKYKIHFQDLLKIIKETAGADPRTCKRYVKILLEFSFLQTEGDYFIFEKEKR